MDPNNPADFVPNDLDLECVNTLRFLSVDAVQKANSGHPGLPMGAAPMAYVLWTRHLKHNPAAPDWYDRDRFVLSAGHGSMLLYALLHLTGYDVSLDQIKQFRQWGSITPGHPEHGMTPGVETTTGPLGQGFGNAVGMAMAEAYLAATFNRPGFDIVDHYTYCIVGDGDLIEGISSEAASLAGHLKLGKLILLYDDNRISLAASTDLAFTEDRAKRFEAFGWHVQVIEDGNDMVAIDSALSEARKETGRPSILLIRTHIGYGSPNKQDTFAAHGSPLGEDEVRLAKEKLDWPLDPPFYIPERALQHFRYALDGGKQAKNDWEAAFYDYEMEYPDAAKEYRRMMQGELPKGWDSDIPNFKPDEKGMATRVASGKVMNAIAPYLPEMFGGAADLKPSTHTALAEQGDFGSPDAKIGDPQGSVGGGWSYAGRNVHFGVREHAMAAILNGLAVHGGILPFGATFLTFSDYMRPSIRLAALMKQRAVYVFTHDSIGLGEDGPTHQPVEHLAALRAIPNLVVLRPADAVETAEAWRLAVNRRESPVALVFTRQKVPTFDRSRVTSAEGVHRGAYILSEAASGTPDLILIGSGSEVHLLLAAQEKLKARSIEARVVSMPSWELFDEQSEDYRSKVLPSSAVVRLAVEAGRSQGWWKYTGDHGDVLGVETFGASAPGGTVMEHYGFTVDAIVARAEALLKRGRNDS